MSTTATLDIDTPHTLSCENIEFYRKNGYIKLKNVLSGDVLEYYGKEISAKVQKLNTNTQPLEERSTYSKAFLQVSNIWEHSEIVKEFILGRKLGRMAAELMEVSGVRIYHDQALYKEPGGGITPWHADQYYWPVSSDRTITAWIPLLALPKEMGPLQFSPGTQNMKFGRDLEISDESEQKLGEVLKNNPLIDEPFDLGEVSFHSGWTFHRAGANISDKPREVMTIIYVDENIRLLEPKTKAHKSDRERWCRGAEIGGLLDGPLNPVVWSSSKWSPALPNQK